MTVAIVVTDGGAETAPTAEVNDITLGSWYTPVVNGLTPNQFPAGSGTIVITGDNFVSPTVTVGGLPAAVTVIDAQHLSVTLPAGLPLGRSLVFVSNRGAWTVRAPDTVQIGSTLAFAPELYALVPPPGFP